MNWLYKLINKKTVKKYGEYHRVKTAHIKVASNDGLELFIDEKGEVVIEDMYLADALHIRPEDWAAFVVAVNKMDRLLILK